MVTRPQSTPNRTVCTKQGHGIKPPRGKSGKSRSAPAGHHALANAAMPAIASLPDCLSARSDCTLIALAGYSTAAMRINPVDVLRCRIVWRLVTELFSAACARDLPEDFVRRRPRCHRRQIAMYLSHVVLSVPYGSIALAFGRDRTTVMHACSVIEDRRDDARYDHFVEDCARCVEAVFAPFGHDHAEL